MTMTKELLARAEEAYSEIARETGIPENWLYRFLHGKVADPGVNRVERLYVHLTCRPLELPHNDA